MELRLRGMTAKNHYAGVYGKDLDQIRLIKGIFKYIYICTCIWVYLLEAYITVNKLNSMEEVWYM